MYGTIRFISDFREPIERIRSKPFSIPKFQYLLVKLESFRCATSLHSILKIGRFKDDI